MENKSPIGNAILTAREEGREEGKREILDKLRKLLTEGYFINGPHHSEILAKFIKDNTPPKGGE